MRGDKQERKECPACSAKIEYSLITGRAVQTGCNCEAGRKLTNKLNRVIEQRKKWNAQEGL